MAATQRGRERGYQDEPERRSLVPILAVVAGVLALAIVVFGVLFLTGFFNRGPSTNVATLPPIDARPLNASPFPAATTDVARTVAARPGDDEPPVRSTHGDWQIRCYTPAGASREQCVLMQFVIAEDRENVGLSVIVVKTADRQSRLMRILAPLSVLLTNGLGLKIDATDMGTVRFARCVPNGCVAEVPLDDQFLAQLSAGRTATFIIFTTPEEGIGIPISLNGFQAGVAALP